MRDNSGRIILLAIVLLVLTAAGLWFYLDPGGRSAPGLVGRLLGGGGGTVLDLAPEPGFGSGGSTRIQGPAIMAPAALLADDKGLVLVATAAQVPGDEHFAAARVNLAGGLDTRFGRQGLAEVSFGGGDQVARGGLLQPDGKLVIFGHASAGGTKRNMAVARLLANGTLDPSFDDDGLVAVRFGDGIQSAEAAGLDAAGRLTLAGYAQQAIAGETYREMAFARLLSDGSLDPGFGQGGLLRDRVRIETRDQAVAALLVTASGELRAGGSAMAAPGAGERAPVLGQWLQGGARDSSFGLRGLAVLPAGSSGQVLALADVGEGGILAAGTRGADGRGSFLLRLQADGNPDASFGDAGLLSLDDAGAAPVQSMQLWPMGRQTLLLRDDGGNLEASLLTAAGDRLPGLSRHIVLGPRNGAAVAALSGTRLWTAHAAGGDPSPVVVQRFDLAGRAAPGSP